VTSNEGKSICTITTYQGESTEIITGKASAARSSKRKLGGGHSRVPTGEPRILPEQWCRVKPRRKGAISEKRYLVEHHEKRGHHVTDSNREGEEIEEGQDHCSKGKLSRPLEKLPYIGL